jgi:cyclopropane fatty-acyl-phospholipid synthase-like methyltransferase
VSILQSIDPRSLLRLPAAYNLHSRVAAPESRKRSFVERILKPKPGSRVLDIGCGTARILKYMPDVIYTGFDLSWEYVEEAKRSYGGNATFYHRRLTREVVADCEPFDLVTAIGVVHHLDDAETELLFSVAHSALAVGGRLVTCDGAFIPGQNPIAHLLLKLDRGRFIRQPSRYEHLARRIFSEVTVTTHDDLNLYPYSHCVMTCRRV